MQTVAELIISVRADISNAQAGLSQIDRQMNTTAAGMATAGRAATAFGISTGAAMTSLGLPIAGIGLAFGALTKTIIGTGAEFQQEIAFVNSLAGGSAKTLDALSHEALKMGQTTVFSAQEAAQAMEQLAREGFTPAQIIGTNAFNSLEQQAVNMAAALRLDMADAANLLGNTMRVFADQNLTAAQTADILTEAILRSGKSAPEFASAFQYAGAAADALKVPLDQVATALSFLESKGIQARNAGTSLRTLFLNLASPTAAAADWITRLGLTVFDSTGTFVGMDSVIGQLHAAFAGLTQQEQLQAVTAIFGKYANSAMLDIIRGGTGALDEQSKKMKDLGSAQDVMNTLVNTLAGSFHMLTSSIFTLKKEMGDAVSGFIKPFVDVLVTLVNAAISLPTPILAVATGLIVLISVVGTLGGAFLLIVPRIMAARDAFLALKEAGKLDWLLGIGAAAPEILIIVAALAALGVAYHYNVFGFRDAVQSVAGDISSAFGKIGDAVGIVADLLGGLGGTKFAAGGLFTGQVSGIQTGVRELGKTFGLSFDQIRTLQSAFIDLAHPVRELRNTFHDVAGGVGSFFDVLKDPTSVKSLEDLTFRMRHLFGREVGGQIVTAVLDLSTHLRGLGEAFSKAFGFSFEDALGRVFNLKTILDGLVTAVTFVADALHHDIIPALGPILLAVLQGADAAIVFLTDHMQQIADVVIGLARIVADVLLTPFRVLSALLHGDLVGAFLALLQPIRDAIDLLSTLGSITIDIAGWALGTTEDLAVWVATVAVPAVVAAAGDLIGAIPSVTVDILDWGVTAAKDVWTAVTDTVKGWLGYGASTPTTGGSRSGPQSFSGGSTGAIPLDSIGVMVMDWAITAAKDLWKSITDQVYAWVGGSANATSGGQSVAQIVAGGGSIPLDVVGVAVGDWAITQAVSLYDKLKAQILAWAFGGGDASGSSLSGPPQGGEAQVGTSGGHDLGTVAVSVKDWLVSQAGDLVKDIGTFAKGLVTGPVPMVISAAIGIAKDGLSWGVGALESLLAWVGTHVGHAVAVLTGVAIGVAKDAVDWGVGALESVKSWIEKHGGNATTTLTGLAVNVKNDAISWAAGATDTIGAWISDAGSKGISALVKLGVLQATGTPDLGNLNRMFSQALNKIDWSQIGFDTGRLTRALAIKIGEGIAGVAKWIATGDHWKTVAGALVLGFAGLPLAIGYLGLKLLPKAAEFLGGFLEGLGLNWPDILSWLGGLPRKALTAIGDVAHTLKTKGVELIAGLMAGWTEKSNELGTWAAGFGGWVAGKFGDVRHALLTKGFDLIVGLMTGWGVQSDTLSTWAKDFGAWVFGQIGNVAGSLYQKGIDLIQGLMDGWTIQSDTLSTWASGFGDWLKGKMSGAGTWLWQIGSDIVTGLYNGLESALYLIDNWVTDAYNHIPGPLRKLLGILSPSTVMHDIGVDIGQGLINGMNAMLGPVGAAAAGLANAAGTAFGPGGAAGSAATGGGGGGGSLSGYVGQASAATGVSSSLINAVMQEESGGVWQTSPAGAIGYMQVMPFWGPDLGLNLNDPYQNILAGAEILAQDIAAASGSIYDALRMYHGYGWDGFTTDTQYAAAILNSMGVPGYQHGGDVTAPLVRVGEAGPEIVALPYGSHVYPHGTGPSEYTSAGGGKGGITISGVNVTVNIDGAQGVDADEIASKVTGAVTDGLAKEIRLRWGL